MTAQEVKQILADLLAKGHVVQDTEGGYHATGVKES